MTMPIDQRIAGFWDWWSAQGRAQILSLLTSGDGESLVGVLGGAVRDIDDRLDYEIGGGDGRVVVCVTGGGDPELRAITQRWVDAAPADDQVTFVPARQADPHARALVLDIGRARVDFGEARFRVEVDDDHSWANVVVHHPALNRRGVDSEQVAYMMLDVILGEDWVEQWVGAIAVSKKAEPGMVDCDAARTTVAELVARTPVESWVLLSAETDRGPMVVSARRPLHWLAAPTAVLAVVVESGYRPRPDGLPDDGELERLTTAEDRLLAELPVGVHHVATVTHAGIRRLHLFATPDSNPEAVQRFAAQTGAALSSFEDPGWQSVAQFR